MSPSEPTADQCNERAMIALSDGHTAYACWYPSMGGYAGKCLIVPSKNGDLDMYVWHDGDFPFNGDDHYRETTNPRKLHHCSGDDFIAFGHFMNKIAGV